jgi:chorismate mutase-like protein
MQAKDGERGIAEWRQDIDRIDAELVALLNRRADCALAIGRIKRRERQPVHVPEREKDVLARVAAANPGPLPGAAVQAIYEAIMAQMRALEDAIGSPG